MHTFVGSRIRSALLLVPLAAVTLPSHQAQGAAFQLRENTAVGLGMAYAGSGSAADTPATVFNNPAGMTQLPGLQVDLGAALILPSFTLNGTATDAFGLPIPGTNNADGGNPAGVPYGYVTYQVSPDVSVGLALTTPFGLATYYGPDFIGRYQADKTNLETVDINPAIAWKVASWLSLGAGFSADHANAEFATGINSTAVAYGALGQLLPLPDGLFRLKGDSWAYGYNFGALVTPHPGTNIGLTYRSRLYQKFSGSVTYNVPLPLSLSPAFQNGNGSAKLNLPDTAEISLTQALSPRWTGYAAVSWTDWSIFKNLDIYGNNGELINATQQNYKNSFYISAGASYRATDKLTLRGGIAFDETPVQTAYLTARVPDADRYWLAIGASYQLSPRATADFGYAHVFVDDSTIHEYSATYDLLQGTYNNHINILAADLRLKFL